MVSTSIKTSSLNSTFPVVLPQNIALSLTNAEFERYVHDTLNSRVKHTTLVRDMAKPEKRSEQDTSLSSANGLEAYPVGLAMESVVAQSGSAFMDTLHSSPPVSKSEYDTARLAALHKVNKAYTDNMGITNKSTLSPLLDLFTELSKTIDWWRLQKLLDDAWKEDSLATLKIIWNARSIHLGKGEHESFYRCIGWLKNDHPETVLTNLPWLVRGVIEKKVRKEDEDAPVLLEREGERADDETDVLYGVSHGYWKDLLNILVLAVNKKLYVWEDPNDILHTKNVQNSKRKRDRNHNTYLANKSGKEKERASVNQEDLAYREERTRMAALKVASEKLEAKNKKHELEKSRHENVLKMMEDPFYRALHLTVARHFAAQMRKDMDLLKGTSKDLKKVSLAAKWAPSLEGFHDKHTFIASTIAELLYSKDMVANSDDSHETYVKQARESYRRLTLSPLRKVLEVVERDVSAETFKSIDYSKVPSLAMDNYKELFVRKDLERFESYIEKVAGGQARISGAVLLPGNLVRQARNQTWGQNPKGKEGVKESSKKKAADILRKTLDGQWKTLVQRIKDSGKLSSAIAVCDVSGSMSGPDFPDGTRPIDTSIGLSLLLAEVTEPPFGGSFITFSKNPEMCSVGGADDKRSFVEKITAMSSSEWGMNTDFSAVFERLILPMAVKHSLKKEDMVKTVFVFSDMQFDAASSDGGGTWQTSYERIKRKFEEAGYDVPQLVFWDLDGGQGKPVVKDEKGTTMVSGYSQAMLKMFLKNGQFDQDVGEDGYPREEVVVEEGDADGGFVAVGSGNRSRVEVDPLAGMWKAIGHEAYGMLKVVD